MHEMLFAIWSAAYWLIVLTVVLTCSEDWCEKCSSILSSVSLNRPKYVGIVGNQLILWKINSDLLNIQPHPSGLVWRKTVSNDWPVWIMSKCSPPVTTAKCLYWWADREISGQEPRALAEQEHRQHGLYWCLWKQCWSWEVWKRKLPVATVPGMGN